MEKAKKSSPTSSSSDISQNKSHSKSTRKHVESKTPATTDLKYTSPLLKHNRSLARTSDSSLEYGIPTSRKGVKQLFEEPPYPDVYEDVHVSSDAEIGDAIDKPLSTIKVKHGHTREIYRVPTPPAQVKRVYHRGRSPEPKIIERIFVRRPAPEIIENIIEIPPQRVRIVNREKVLAPAKPIVYTKIVYLQAQEHSQHHHHHDHQEQVYTYSMPANVEPVSSTYVSEGSPFVSANQPISTQSTEMTYQLIQPTYQMCEVSNMPPNYSYGYYY